MADDSDRVAALHALQLLDTPREERFDRVVRLAQQVFGVPMVAVNLIDADRQWPKAAVGLPRVSLPRPLSFCNQTIDTADGLVVPDATADSRFAEHPMVTGGPGVRFYAGEPLRSPDGHRVGALCLVDREPRDLTEAQRRLLRDLADWVEHELAGDADLAQAADVQRRLLPRAAPAIPGYEVAARCVPARLVGGDFYDWHPAEDGHQLVLADVMGKGTAAALIAASVRAVLRGAARYNELGPAVTRSAVSLQPDLDETATFVTAFVLRLHPDGRVEFVDAGHGLAVLLRPDGSWRHVGGDGLPIGVQEGAEWTAEPLSIDPGETLVVVSDGILDAFASGRQGLEQVLALYPETDGAGDLVSRIAAMVTGELEDDFTMLAVRRVAG